MCIIVLNCYVRKYYFVNSFNKLVSNYYYVLYGHYNSISVFRPRFNRISDTNKVVSRLSKNKSTNFFV